MDTLTTATPSVHRKYFRHILGACGSCYFERQAGKFILGEEGDQFSVPTSVKILHIA